MNFNKYKAITSVVAFFLFTSVFSQEQELNHLYTYIDSTVVEQRQVYVQQDIEESHAESFVEFFQTTGIQLLSYGPYGLESKPSIRGFTDETVRVIIDGICVNNAQYGTFDFTTLNLNEIERIEIVRGGFTEGVSDEGAVGGVIYITTKKQSLGHSFYSDSSVKSFLNQNTPIDTITQSLGYSGQLSDADYLKLSGKFTYAQNKYPFTNYKNQTEFRKNAAVTDGNSDIKYSHFFGNGNSFSAGESFYAGNKNIPGQELSHNPGIQKDYDNRLNFNLAIPQLTNYLKLDTNLAWLCNNRFYSDNSQDSKHFVNTITFASYAEFYKYQWFNQTAGITFDVVHLDSTDDGNHLQFSGTYKQTSKFTINQIFCISIPVALKVSGHNFEAVPKLGLKASTKYADFILNGYRMVQFPNMDDLYWESNGFKGNPDLKAENGWGAEFTLNIHNLWLPFSICTYTNYYENKIQWATKDGKWAPQNVASAFYFGINLFSEKSLFNDLIKLKASAEYLDSRLLDESNKYTYKKHIMWTPDWVYSLSASLNLKAVSITLEDNYTGKRYKTNMNISYLEPYSLFNASLQLNLWKHIKPYTRIDNLLDTKYESVDGYPMPGTSVTFGVRCNW